MNDTDMGLALLLVVGFYSVAFVVCWHLLRWILGIKSLRFDVDNLRAEVAALKQRLESQQEPPPAAGV